MVPSVEGRLGQWTVQNYIFNKFKCKDMFLFWTWLWLCCLFLENGGEKNALTGEFEGELLSSLLSYGIIGTIIIMLLSYYFCFLFSLLLYKKTANNNGS